MNDIPHRFVFAGLGNIYYKNWYDCCFLFIYGIVGNADYFPQRSLRIQNIL